MRNKINRVLRIMNKTISETFFILFHKQFDHKYQHATDHGYREQSGTEPCGDDSGNECHQPGNRRLGSVDDGWEGHDSQCHVRYIVQKGLNELILDRFPDQCQG